MVSIVDHLISRYVDLELHRPVIDETDRVATFYLYNGAGGISGYQQYRPDANKMQKNNPKEGRYFTCRNKAHIAVFGAESLHREGPVYVTEGIFDAVRITKLHGAAIAVLTNNPGPDVRNYLQCLGRKIVAVCDYGPAGAKLANVGDIAITMPPEWDLGDAPQEYVAEMMAKCYGGYYV